MADRKLVSVTTVLKVLDKPALVPWAAYAVCDAFIEDPQYWASEAERDPVETRNRLANARFKPPKGTTRSAAKLGTDIHDLCERWVIDGRPPLWDESDEIAPYMAQFGRFLDVYQPTYLAAEFTCYSVEWGYAGTCDGILRIDGVDYIFDYKTSRKSYDRSGQSTRPYPEAALQLAAYRHADIVAVWAPRKEERWSDRWYHLSDEEIAAAQASPTTARVPEVDAGLVISITPEHCHPHPVAADETQFALFLSALDLWNGMQEQRQAVGPVLDPADTAMITRSSV